LNLTATVTVKGDPASLREYRSRVNELLDEEGAGSYRELHTEKQLEYRFKLRGGIPFPPFVETSLAFPDLTIEADWTEADEGRSVLREQAAQTQTPGGPALRDVRADADGRIRLAVVCERWREFWHGYAIASDQHAFFRIAGTADACELYASDGAEAEWAERWTVSSDNAAYGEFVQREPIAKDELREIDRLVQDFSREWLWFGESPPEETAVERQRFEAYGFPVHAANLRSEKLRKVLRSEDGGLALSSFGEDARWIPELLRRCWLRPEK
jgi:hypothetical protein